ncbi:hypothetical protein EBB07_27780 [Paenibacillaceae bacterium]|nr:hypothetical protein EBB07_27780 [Paenibacillaceae bacterium]
MALPFRSDHTYNSQVWPALTISLKEDHLTALGCGELECLSNAVYNGGFQKADRWMNWKVPMDYDCSDPVADYEQLLVRKAYSPQTVGMITAAKLTCASIVEMADEACAIVCCTTAGTRNAARAGSDRTLYAAYKAGTINTMLLIDGRLTPSAMVNALMTAVEAKAAALGDLGIKDMDNGLQATGTTSDALLIGVSQSERFLAVHEYAGTATTLGGAIGKMVYASVYEAATAQYE